MITDNGGDKPRGPSRDPAPGKMPHLRSQAQAPTGHEGGSLYHTTSRRAREGTPPNTLLCSQGWRPERPT